MLIFSHFILTVNKQTNKKKNNQFSWLFCRNLQKQSSFLHKHISIKTFGKNKVNARMEVSHDPSVRPGLPSIFLYDIEMWGRKSLLVNDDPFPSPECSQLIPLPSLRLGSCFNVIIRPIYSKNSPVSCEHHPFFLNLHSHSNDLFIISALKIKFPH